MHRCPFTSRFSYRDVQGVQPKSRDALVACAGRVELNRKNGGIMRGSSGSAPHTLSIRSPRTLSTSSDRQAHSRSMRTIRPLSRSGVLGRAVITKPMRVSPSELQATAAMNPATRVIFSIRFARLCMRKVSSTIQCGNRSCLSQHRQRRHLRI